MTLLRMYAATQFGQTVDEAHYVLYGQFLDWSYFDHPPLIGWIHGIFKYLPFNDLLNARLPSILISLTTSFLVFTYLKAKNFSLKNSSLAVIGLNLTPMFNTVSIALLPDTVLMPLTIFVIDRTEKVIRTSNYKNWILLGLALGLSALSKYTAVVFIPALIIIFILKNRISDLLKPQLWSGVLTATLFIVPVLYWNFLNNFISFKYQGDHVSKMDGSAINNIIQSLGVQAFSWGIGPFVLSLVMLFVWTKNWKQLTDKQIGYIFSICLFLFFAWVSISEVLLPHWMLVFFAFFLPISTAHLLEKHAMKRLTALAYLPSAIISFALLFETAFKVFPAEKTAPLYEGVYGWDALLDGAVQKLNTLESSKKAIAVMNWTLGSRTMYYSKNRAEVFVLDHRFDQFDIWNKNSPIGYDFIVMIENSKKDEHLAMLNCHSLEQIGENVSTLSNIPVNHFLYYSCKNLIEINK